MRNLIIFSLLLEVVFAALPSPPPPAPTTPYKPRPPPSPSPPLAPHSAISILRQTNEINSDGSYQWSYEADNGISAEEKGQPLNIPDAPIGAEGNFRYTAPDGTPISLRYIANENGFQPNGDHIPTPPPIPELISRALDWIAAQSHSFDVRSHSQR